MIRVPTQPQFVKIVYEKMCHKIGFQHATMTGPTTIEYTGISYEINVTPRALTVNGLRYRNRRCVMPKPIAVARMICQFIIQPEIEGTDNAIYNWDIFER